MTRPQPQIDRGKTAMRRGRCSRPVSLALESGLIHPEVTFFDYGCGHGDDLLFLESAGVPSSGWDPSHRPDGERRAANVVNLGYVLNVIESDSERASVLRDAYDLARDLLVCSVRVDRSLNTSSAEEFGDGLLTQRGTFQKIYTQSEFVGYLQDTLGVRPTVADLGICYIFKSPELESAFLAKSTLRRSTRVPASAIEEFKGHPLGRGYIELAGSLGRQPRPNEFPEYAALLSRYGPASRLRRLLTESVDSDQFELSRSQRREDLLTFLAQLPLRGLKYPKLTSLDIAVQHDIRGIWKSYRAAQSEARGFLFSIGNAELVKSTFSSLDFGKLLPEDYYLHRMYIEDLPAVIRLIVFAAKQIVGDVSHDLVKISTDGRAVSFLKYIDFDEDPHPRLLYSTRVYLPKASYGIRDYAASDNPPILHRKETLVREDYPFYSLFASLTQEEEAHDLLSRSDIGNSKSWHALLESKGLHILEHRVFDKS